MLLLDLIFDKKNLNSFIKILFFLNINFLTIPTSITYDDFNILMNSYLLILNKKGVFT